MERKQTQVLTYYLPVVKDMTLDSVASSISVAHHNRSIIRSIEVTPGSYMPVRIYEDMAVWEESKTKYPKA